MPTKGEQTQKIIIQKAAALFNVRGYAGTSLSDIIDATGIQKGGIYRHFESKETLAVAAFDYAMQLRQAEVEAVVTSGQDAIRQLSALSQTFLRRFADDVLPGGCPIQNTAVEADDFFPLLKTKAQAGMDQLRIGVQTIVIQGKERGELHPFVNGDVVATIVIALCEGALMMSKLYDDSQHLQRAFEHLDAYFESLKVSS